MPEIAKIKRALPLRDQVLDGVIRGLTSGTLRPGERLTEAGVATALGVSRTPVREALGLLAQRGTLTRRAQGGFVVATPSLKILRTITTTYNSSSCWLWQVLRYGSSCWRAKSRSSRCSRHVTAPPSNEPSTRIWTPGIGPRPMHFHGSSQLRHRLLSSLRER